MLAIHRIKCSLFLCGHDDVIAGKHLLWREASETTMVMLGVVPVKVIHTPCSGLLEVLELTWIIRLVFCCFELALAEGVVITHSGTTMTGNNLAASEALNKRCGRYW